MLFSTTLLLKLLELAEFCRRWTAETCPGSILKEIEEEAELGEEVGEEENLGTPSSWRRDLSLLLSIRVLANACLTKWSSLAKLSELPPSKEEEEEEQEGEE